MQTVRNRYQDKGFKELHLRFAEEVVATFAGSPWCEPAPWPTAPRSPNRCRGTGASQTTVREGRTLGA